MSQGTFQTQILQSSLPRNLCILCRCQLGSHWTRQAVSQISGQVVLLMCLTVTFINTTSYASSSSKAAWWGIQYSSQTAVHSIHQCKQTQSTALHAGFHSRDRQLPMLPCVLLLLTPQTLNTQSRYDSSVTVTYWDSWLQPDIDHSKHI